VPQLDSLEVDSLGQEQEAGGMNKQDRGAFARHAVSLLDMGYSPIPLHPASKHPWVKSWQLRRERAYSLATVARFALDPRPLGLAVAGGYGGLVPLDIDTDDADVMAALGRVLPRPNVAKKGRRGWVAFYRAAGELPPGRDYMLPKVDGKPGKPLVSILTTRKTVLPPSVHPDTGKPYRWLTGTRTLFNVPAAELVPLTAQHVADMGAALRPWCPPPAPAPVPMAPRWQGRADSHMRTYALACLQGRAKDLAGMAKDSGRNIALFRACRYLGKYVAHGVISASEFESAMASACQGNGLWIDASSGRSRGCMATIRSGLKLATGDALPVLRHWGRSDGR
jgi:hypothetical protein